MRACSRGRVETAIDRAVQPCEVGPAAGMGPPVSGGGTSRGNVKREGRPGSGNALHHDIAAELPGQPLADRQAQPGPSRIVPMPGLHAVDRVETGRTSRRLVMPIPVSLTSSWSTSTGVLELDHTGSQPDRALLGELDGVVEQIHENLLDSQAGPRRSSAAPRQRAPPRVSGSWHSPCAAPTPPRRR